MRQKQHLQHLTMLDKQTRCGNFRKHWLYYSSEDNDIQMLLYKMFLNIQKMLHDKDKWILDDKAF